jgi:hypothetical protein
MLHLSHLSFNHSDFLLILFTLIWIQLGILE